jgi:hypothetical protein
LIGAVGALLPDAALATFGWRREWLSAKHPLVILHRFLHSPYGWLLALAIGYLSHIVVDHYSTHRSKL